MMVRAEKVSRPTELMDVPRVTAHRKDLENDYIGPKSKMFWRRQRAKNPFRTPSRRPSSRRASSPRKPMSSTKDKRVSASSSEDESYARSKPKHILKPPKFDGTGSFETYLAQFRNCAVYNQWTEAEKLVHLRGSLDNEAGQVLWDYSAETTISLKKMVKVLKERFGEANQAENTESK